MRRTALLLALAAASLRADLEFSGLYIAGGDPQFTVSEGATGEASGWLGIGGAFHAYTLRAFDREHEVLTVEKDGACARLRLREPRVKDGRMSIDGTLTLWPGPSTKPFHASLYLGEAQSFPLRNGEALRLKVERRPDGTLLYHPTLVTRDAAGRETAEVWPSLLTAPGGEFSLRVGDAGLSFKP